MEVNQEGLEKLNEKVNVLRKEIHELKEELREERVSSLRLGNLIGETIKQTMKIVEQLPFEFEKRLDRVLDAENVFVTPFGRSLNDHGHIGEKHVEMMSEKSEKIRKKAEEVGEKLREDLLSRLQREFNRRGVLGKEIRKEMTYALQEVEEKVSQLGQEMNEAMKASISKSRREFQKNLTEAVETFDSGRIADILSTLASPERLEILRFLNEEARYYSEIGEEVELGPSSLKFHLGKLKALKLVEQERARGKYFITAKGKRALRLGTYLGGILLPPEGD